MKIWNQDRLWLLYLALLMILAPAQGHAALNQQYPDEFSNSSVSELFTRSIISYSLSEKKTLRSYIALKFPNSPEGMLSKSSMAGYNGKKELQKKILKECVSQYGTKAPACLGNLLFYASENKVRSYYIDLTEQALQSDPSIYDYWLLTNVYFEIKEEQQKEAFLERWKGRVPKEVFDYIRAIELRDEKKYKKSESLFRKVFISDVGPYIVESSYDKWVQIQTDHLMVSSMPDNKKVGILIEPLKGIMQNFKGKLFHPGVRQAVTKIWLILAEKVATRFHSKNGALQLYEQSLNFYPTVEAYIAMAKIENSYERLYQHSKALNILMQGLEIFPKQAELEVQIARILFRNGDLENHLQRATDYFERSIKHAYT